MSDLNSEQPDASPIRLRLGVNLGDVISQDNDIFRDDVNIAARLKALSKPGEISLIGGACPAPDQLDPPRMAGAFIRSDVIK